MKTMLKFTLALCIGSVVSAALIAGFVYFVCMARGQYAFGRGYRVDEWPRWLHRRIRLRVRGCR